MTSLSHEGVKLHPLQGAKPAGPPAPSSDGFDFASDDTLVASPIQRPTTLHLYDATEARAMS